MKSLYLTLGIVLCLLLILVSHFTMAASPTSTIVPSKSSLSKGMEFLLEGYIKSITPLPSNMSVPEIKKSYNLAKSEIVLAKTSFEAASVTSANEKTARDQLVLICDYYIPRMDFLSGEKQAIREFVDGLLALESGDYSTAKSKFEGARSLYGSIEKNRVQMTDAAKKIDPAAWNIVIPRHENITYIEKDLHQFSKDWEALSQAAIHLSSAGSAKKQGNIKVAESEVKSGISILGSLKDSPFVGKQASVWNANLGKK